MDSSPSLGVFKEAQYPGDTEKVLTIFRDLTASSPVGDKVGRSESFASNDSLPSFVGNNLESGNSSSNLSETPAEPAVVAVPALPDFSSPLLDPATIGHNFVEFTANGHPLPFLSLIVAGTRSLDDIGFDKSHALMLYLLYTLEEALYQYAKVHVPSELDVLQVLSADELELQAWRAFLSQTAQRSRKVEENADVNEIRHVAVHRKKHINTLLIRAAVDEAMFLGEHDMVEETDMILRVFYADAVGADTLYPVTDEERSEVKELLWPQDYTTDTMHQLLDLVQNLGEQASFAFCQRHLPTFLASSNFTSPECLELSAWHWALRIQFNWPQNSADDVATFRDDIIAQLDEADTASLRNSASHRDTMFECDFSDFLTDKCRSVRPITSVAQYCRILGEERTAAEIEAVWAKAIHLLKRNHGEWMDATWCDTRDWKAIWHLRKERQREWEQLMYRKVFSPPRVDIMPIYRLYSRGEERLRALVSGIEGWREKLYPPGRRLMTPPPVVELSEEEEARRVAEEVARHRAEWETLAHDGWSVPEAPSTTTDTLDAVSTTQLTTPFCVSAEMLVSPKTVEW